MTQGKAVLADKELLMIATFCKMLVAAKHQTRGGANMSKEHNNTTAREFQHLTITERKTIERLLKNGTAKSEIARITGRSRRTIQREIKRASVVQRRQNPYASRNPAVPDFLDSLVYLSDTAQRVYEAHRANCVNPCKLASCMEFITFVEGEILSERKLSPDAVIGAAKASGVFKNTISSRTFYNYVEQGLCRVKSIDLLLKVRRKPKNRVRLHKKRLGKSIDERPASVLERSELGHWEGDGVVGKGGKGQVITLVERQTGLGIMYNVGDRKSDKIVDVLDSLEERYGPLFPVIFKTITFDNGSEFAASDEMEKGGRTKVYYAHPYSAYERGTNENWNGIVRRFLPKGTSFAQLTQEALDRIALYINTMPRKRFGYKTPLDLWKMQTEALLTA
jgi:IS30 family transposase